MKNSLMFSLLVAIPSILAHIVGHKLEVSQPTLNTTTWTTAPAPIAPRSSPSSSSSPALIVVDCWNDGRCEGNNASTQFRSEVDWERVRTWNRNFAWTRDLQQTLIFPQDGDGAVVPLVIPQDTDIQQWVERITFVNLPTITSQDSNDVSKPLREFVANTKSIVCGTKTVHSVTFLPHTDNKKLWHPGPPSNDIWATQMTFSKFSHGYACNDKPTYPGSVSRCMAMYVSPWTAEYSLPIKTVKTRTTTKSNTDHVFIPQIVRSTSKSFSTWVVTVPSPHWGNVNPQHLLHPRHPPVHSKECHDEISCYYRCKREAAASTRLAIVLACVFGGLLLVLLPIIYFYHQPQHLQRLREGARQRDKNKASKSLEAGALADPSADRVPRPNRNPVESGQENIVEPVMSTSEGRSTPKRMTTEYNKIRYGGHRHGMLGRAWNLVRGK